MTLTDPTPVAVPLPGPTPAHAGHAQAARVHWQDSIIDWATGTRIVHVRGHRFTLTQRNLLIADFRRDGELLGSLRRRALAPGESTFQIEWRGKPSRSTAEAVAALLNAPQPGIAETTAVIALSLIRLPLRALGR